MGEVVRSAVPVSGDGTGASLAMGLAEECTNVVLRDVLDRSNAVLYPAGGESALVAGAELVSDRGRDSRPGTEPRTRMPLKSLRPAVAVPPAARMKRPPV